MITIKKILTDWLLLIIILFAAVLRLWNLGNIPPHLTPDEASLGYNAYSILKTGKDEYGKVLPFIFKSFGDYKPGLYVYLTVPFVGAFGLNEWSVRLPSAVAGILSVWLVYLVVLSLFKDKKLSLLSAFVASITPWLIYFSRGAWEVNVSLALVLAGIYFFLKALHSPRFMVHSLAFFSATLLTYQGAKLSTGIVVLILLVVYWKDFWKINKRHLILAVVVGLVIATPIIFSLFRGQTGRLNVFSVFSYPRSQEYLQKFLDHGREKIGSLSYYLFHSEALNFKRGILGRYFNHFSGRFLFFEGDWANPRHSAPYQGMLLLSDIVLLILGLIYVVKNYSSNSKNFLLILAWLVLAPLPAVLSRDQVHAVRAMNMVVPLIIVISFGLREILQKPRVLAAGFGIFYFLAFTYFTDAYYLHVPKHNSQLWEYGYKQIVETVTPIQGNYKKVLVQQSFAQPYIYFLFFQKYDPVKYQKEAELTVADSVLDVGYVTKLDNIEFGPIDWSVNRGDHSTLIVGDTVRIPPEDSKDEDLFKLIKEIKYLNGRDTAFRILEIK